MNDLRLFYNILVKDKRLFGNQASQVTYTGEPGCLITHTSYIFVDMADDRGGMEASGTRAPRALGHLVFLLINFSDVCSNFISFLQGGKGSGTRVFGQ